MIELVFVVCLSASEQRCEERHLVYQDLTPTACVMGAQPTLAGWINAHPAYRIQSWRCRPVDFDERET